MVLVGYVHQVRLVAELDRISFALWVRPKRKKIELRNMRWANHQTKEKGIDGDSFRIHRYLFLLWFVLTVCQISNSD